MKIPRYILPAILAFPLPACAQDDASVRPPSMETNAFLDPAFHDFAEMSYGYLNPEYAPRERSEDRRDSLAGMPASGLAALRAASPSVSGLSGSMSLVAGGSVRPPEDRADGKPAPGQYYKVTFANEAGPLSSFVARPDSAVMAGFGAGDFVFVSVLPGTGDHPAVIRSLAKTGFKFSGERTQFSGSARKKYLTGWVPYAALPGVYKNPLVRRVAIEDPASGEPFRASIRFTLRAPGGKNSGLFVSDFITRLGESAGFVPETISPLPENAGNAKFMAFDITGTLPVDKIKPLSLSPFVASMEFRDGPV